MTDTGRRLLAILGIAGLVAAPPLLLRLFCVGGLCDEPEAAQAAVPFCSLPAELRSRIASGFRDGRSPDILAVTGSSPVRGASGLEGVAPAWPSIEPGDAGRVPLVFHGAGIAPAARVPAGTTLDAVAPTVSGIIGFDRPHPEVRSGREIAGVAAGQEPRLVLLVVWKGVGSRDLEAAPGAWPNLRGLLEEGAGTLDGDVGSLPLDPSATLTTIGTGGLPSQHGITGTILRNDQGVAVPAWGGDAPFSVIAALGDDLDEALNQRPRVGIVATTPQDRGAIGKNWYVEVDRDDVVGTRAGAGMQAEAARDLLESGYGHDDVPDLLVVVMRDSVGRMDRSLRPLLRDARAESRDSVALVVTSTGSSPKEEDDALSAADLGHAVEAEMGRGGQGVIEASAVGGLFLDQDVLGAEGISEDRVIRALRRLKGKDGRAIMADVFSGIAIEFEEFC